MGPEGGSKGGMLVDEGTPEQLAKNHKKNRFIYRLLFRKRTK